MEMLALSIPSGPAKTNKSRPAAIVPAFLLLPMFIRCKGKE